MSENIEVTTETWIENQLHEVAGYAWRCGVCGVEEHQLHGLSSVGVGSGRHMREEHQIFEEPDEDTLWNRQPRD